MAAAARTISDFLRDTNTKPQNYDLILTGDPGFTGSKLIYEILEQEYKIQLENYHIKRHRRVSMFLFVDFDLYLCYYYIE